jgi:hypothetical protein
MFVQQSASQRNQRIAARALYATVGVACGNEIYGILHQQELRILTIEYGIVYAASFVLAFTFIWLTAKRNVQISITRAGLEISHDEDVVRFSWHDVKRAKQPAVLQRYWLFELKNTKRIKISTQYFSRTQIKQFNSLVTNINTNTGATAAATGISHPRIVDSNRR